MRRNDEQERKGAAADSERPAQEVGGGTDEDPAAEENELSPEFPEVPNRDVGLGHTTDVNAPPNTTGHSEDVPEPPD